MTSLIFDVETNGFLAELDRVHSLVIEDADTHELKSYADQPDYAPIKEGVERLADADVLIGHNIISFDNQALKKVYPWFKPRARMLDTMVLARLFWPELKKTDAAMRQSNPSFPGKLVGSYKLEAFGYRLNLMKGEYKGPWDTWSREMQDYCEQDVRVTAALWRKALLRWRPEREVPYSDESIELEMDVQEIVARQVRRGVRFNEQEAAKLYSRLAARREELEATLKATFPPWYRRDGKDALKTPKVTLKTGVTKGWTYTKIKLVEFNPSSRDHIAQRLQAMRGWVPTQFTDGGQPKVDDAIMSLLPYPEAPLLTEYLMIQKRIGQLAEGDKAWLKKVQNGRIHGGVNTNGAVTRRMTHVDPNLGQTPTVDVPYGPECRALFEAGEGFKLVGVDADSLELRLLGGYMSPYDGGAYIDVVLKGNKALGTDMHSVNARAIGLDPKKEYNVDGIMLPGRGIGKTWFYAMVYGSGDENLGWIMGYRGDPNNPAHWGKNKRTGERIDLVAKRFGGQSKRNFAKNLPALGTLIEKVGERAKGRGFLISVDKGKLHVRKAHAALNTLLQSAGAIFMKKALVILDRALQADGLVPGEDYEFVLNIHDEWQIEVLPQYTDFVSAHGEYAIKLAGEHWKFPCPLVGNADVGDTWADTH
jgi:DNA polymerase-1